MVINIISILCTCHYVKRKAQVELELTVNEPKLVLSSEIWTKNVTEQNVLYGRHVLLGVVLLFKIFHFIKLGSLIKLLFVKGEERAFCEDMNFGNQKMRQKIIFEIYIDNKYNDNKTVKMLMVVVSESYISVLVFNMHQLYNFLNTLLIICHLLQSEDERYLSRNVTHAVFLKSYNIFGTFPFVWKLLTLNST